MSNSVENNKNIELLAPAGSMESLFAAVNNGANAVYLGGSKFSARAYASNFDNESMKKAVDYCHSYGAKIYVTMNTLLKEDEVSEAIKYVGYLYEIGVDALIIQDAGLIKMIREKYPDFEMHASTQLTIHSGYGALYFKEKGFKRIVLSRELSFDEIEYISKKLNIETEIFIHGALCVCYSGRCLMSSMIGGRSGNRGRCAQPCRMEYTLKSKNLGERKGYLLSPKDICTISDIKEILKSNASSLKIEGRMKRPEYVAGVVSNYRKAIDSEISCNTCDNYNISQGKKNLLQLFNREGFSEAYLKKNTGKDMMSYNFPKNTGVQIGKALDNNTVLLNEDISEGDGIRIRNSGFIISKIYVNNKEVLKASKGEKVKIIPKDYKKNDVLYRTSSKELFDNLENTVKPYVRKIPLQVKADFSINNQVLLVTEYNGIKYSVLGEKYEKALNKPVSKDRILENLKKSGEYPFKIQDVHFINFDEGFIRISSLNAIRRELFQKIIKSETSKARRDRNKVLNHKEEFKEKKYMDIDYLFVCTKQEQIDVLVQNGYKNIAIDVFSRIKDGISFDVLDKYKNVNFYILAPEIIKSEIKQVFAKINTVLDKISGIVTSNAAVIKEYRDKTVIIGDYKLNIFNSNALTFYKQDINNLTLSVELNRKEIKSLVKNLSKDETHSVIVYIYGKIENMVSEYCPIGSTFGGKSSKSACNGACMKDEFVLVDRMKENFKVITDKYCRSHIYNSVPVNLIDEREDLKSMGINSFRLDFKDENRDDVIRVIKMLNNNIQIESKYYTKGHYRRGVE